MGAPREEDKGARGRGHVRVNLLSEQGRVLCARRADGQGGDAPLAGDALGEGLRDLAPCDGRAIVPRGEDPET